MLPPVLRWPSQNVCAVRVRHKYSPNSTRKPWLPSRRLSISIRLVGVRFSVASGSRGAVAGAQDCGGNRGKGRSGGAARGVRGAPAASDRRSGRAKAVTGRLLASSFWYFGCRPLASTSGSGGWHPWLFPKGQSSRYAKPSGLNPESWGSRVFNSGGGVSRAPQN